MSNARKAAGHVINGVPTVMSFEEFYDAGFMQEVNRLFFHPHGLSLQYKYKGKSAHPCGLEILDARFDPEGFMYDDNELSLEKAAGVYAERIRHSAARARVLQNEDGKDIQQVGRQEVIVDEEPEDPRSKLTVF